MSKNRIQTWLLIVVLGAGLLLATIAGMWVYMTATSTPLHPDPQQVPSAAGPATPAEWAGAVDRGRQIVRAGIAGQNLPGLSVAIGVDGKIVWAEGFGWADLENQVPVTPDTRFRLGTASKLLTSAAVGLLLEQNRLALDEKIQTYVPEYPEKEWPLTLRHLMGHLGGVSTDGGDEGPLYSVRCGRPVEGLQAFKDRGLLFEPGTRYRYSSYGWILVSAAVEAAAGDPFMTFMRRRVFDPPGMDDTTDDSMSETIPNRATFYFPRFASEPRHGLHLMRPVDYSCYAGASAFLSTPSDLVRFATAVNEGRLLQPATVELLQTSHRLPSGEETGYGLGWDIETGDIAGRPARLVGHDGETLGGTVVSLLTVPAHRIVVAVMSNISYADTRSLALQIAQAFADRTRVTRTGTRGRP